MLDPKIWESCYDKNWSCEDFAVIVAAISSADDDGRGKVSMIKRNLGSMISEKKLFKCLKILEDSIHLYKDGLYYLPNWNEYQTINRPRPSKLPAPIIDHSLMINKQGSDECYTREDNLKEENSNRLGPILNEVIIEFEAQGLPKTEAEKFWSFYDSQEWCTTSGAYIGKRWQSKIIGWMNNSKQFSHQTPKETTKLENKRYERGIGE